MSLGEAAPWTYLDTKKEIFWISFKDNFKLREQRLEGSIKKGNKWKRIQSTHTEAHISTKVAGAHRTGRFYWVFSWHPSKGKLNGQRQDMEIWMTPDLKLHLICHIYVVITSASLTRNLFLYPVGGGLWFILTAVSRRVEKRALVAPVEFQLRFFSLTEKITWCKRGCSSVTITAEHLTRHVSS